MTPAEFAEVEEALVDSGVPPELVIPVCLLAERLQVWRAERDGAVPVPAEMAVLVDTMLRTVRVDPAGAAVGDLLAVAYLVRRPAPKTGGRRRSGVVAA